MEFSNNSHYFIMKSGKNVVLYNKLTKQYERWIFIDKFNNKISINKSQNGISYDIKDHVQKLELQIQSPKVIKLEDKISASSWVEKYGPSSFFETKTIPDLEEINGKSCSCSKVEIEVTIEEFISPNVDDYAKSYVLGRLKKHIPPRVDDYAKSYVLGRLKKHVPPRVDDYAKSYVLGRLKKHVPPKIDDFSKSYVLGRLKKHIPPRVDYFAKSYTLGRLQKLERDKYSTLYWKVIFLIDPRANVSESALIYFRNDIPNYFYPAISKESYINLNLKEDLLDSLFSINGITKAGCDSYRIYIEKSEVYFWEEILIDLIQSLTTFFRNYLASELPGSRRSIEDPDSSIRNYFNKEDEEFIIVKNTIPAGSPKEQNEIIVKVPKEQTRNGQIEKFQNFVSSNPRIPRKHTSKINYKYNPVTRKWYKEVSNPKTV